MIKKIQIIDILLILFFILIGGILRVYNLPAFPPGLHGDEAWTGLEAKRILMNGSIGIWSMAAFGEPSLRMYLTAFLFFLFGPSITTIRLSLALPNIVSIPFFYGIAFLITKSRRSTILATILYCCSFVTLLFSRNGQFVSFTLPFYLCLFFFLYAIRSRKNIAFIACGISLGLTSYAYFALWTTFVLIGISCTLLIFYVEKKISFIKQCLLLCIAAFIIVSPLLFFGMQHPDAFTARYRMTVVGEQNLGASYENSINLSKVELYTQNFTKNVQMFFLKGDSDTMDNLQSQALFNLVGVLFISIGLLYTVFHFRKFRYWFLLLYFFYFLILASFTSDAPNFRRTQLSITASYILIGIGIDTFLIFIERNKYIQKIKWLNFAPIILGILIILYIAGRSTLFFFYNFSQAADVKQTFAYPRVKLAKFLQQQSQPIYVYYYSVGDSYHHETLRFLASNIPGEDRSREFGTFSLINTRTTNVVYVMMPEYYPAFEQVMKLYPLGKKYMEQDVNRTLFYAWIVPIKYE